MSTNEKVGWFEFEWKTTLGKWVCRWFGHSSKEWQRCKRCLCLLSNDEKEIKL